MPRRTQGRRAARPLLVLLRSGDWPARYQAATLALTATGALAGAPWYGLSVLVAAYGTGLVARGLPALRPLGVVLAAGAAAKFLALDIAMVGQRSVLELRLLAGAAATFAERIVTFGICEQMVAI